jgi:methionine synthase II (cobalamin-independent)
MADDEQPPSDAPVVPAAPVVWSAGATGVGSMPGTDPLEACRTVLDLLPDLPFLPELPGRGPHADVVGRSTALLADLPVDLQPTGWRLVPRTSRDGRRARDLLARDLDALEEVADTRAPAVLKVQCAGPWTLAASLELPRGDRALADPAAVDDLAGSLAEGLRTSLADLRRRLPGTRLVLQLDEPSLPTVLAGRVPTASGFGVLRAPAASRAVEVLRGVLEQASSDPAATVVHCCAPHPPVDLLVRAGVGAVSLDATLLTPRDDDPLGAALEDGVGLLLGLVPSRQGPLPASVTSDLAQALTPATELRRRLGLAPDVFAASVVVTPTCGLAGASPGYARRALQACGELVRRLGEDDA